MCSLLAVDHHKRPWQINPSSNKYCKLRHVVLRTRTTKLLIQGCCRCTCDRIAAKFDDPSIPVIPASRHVAPGHYPLLWQYRIATNSTLLPSHLAAMAGEIGFKRVCTAVLTWPGAEALLNLLVHGDLQNIVACLQAVHMHRCMWSRTACNQY